MTARPVRVIYIGGYGRSGSTVLDRLIGARTGGASCGEISNLHRALGSVEEYCSCGALAAECPFWREVMQRWRARVPGFDAVEHQRLQRRYESRTQLFNPFRRLVFSGVAFERYLEYSRALFEALAEVADTDVIVDSSKSSGRALALAQDPRLDLHLVQLVRDVRGVAHSCARAYEKSPLGGVQTRLLAKNHFRTAAAWSFENYCFKALRRLVRRPSARIRYEDYANGASAAIDALVVEQLGIAPGGGAPQSGPAKALHQIAGNRVRLRADVSLALDEAWRRDMSRSRQSLLYLATAFLMRRFGYHR